MKKFELSTEHKINWLGRTLYRIKACISFTTASGEEIKAGDLGGYIEKEKNLSHGGNAWVYGDARVCGDARVYGNARVYGDARVYGNARVSGNARVCGDAMVYGDARVSGNAWVCGDAKVCGNARVSGNARVYGDAWVYGNARVCKQNHWLLIGPIGSRFGFTTFFRDKDNEITVSCGCFLGKLAAFKEKVSATHGDNHHAVMYRNAAALAELHIELLSDEVEEDDDV